MYEKLLTPPGEPARLDPDLPVNSDLSLGYRAADWAASSLSFSPTDSCSDPSSSSFPRFLFGPFFYFFTEILVWTLLLLFPPRF